jgi:3'-5' exoribonuclease
MTTQFTANERFEKLFLLKGIDERRTRNGKPYLTLVLGTPDSSFEGRIWDMDLKSLPGLVEGDPVKAVGVTQLYQERLQLIVETISKVDSPVDPREIFPATEVPEEQLRTEFKEAVSNVQDAHLRSLFTAMEGDTPIFEAFFTSPAAITMHHARIGGLAEHSLGVCRLALAAAETAPWLDKELLVAGALLHDIGKIIEYEVAGDFRYSLQGKLVGHISLGASLIEKWIGTIPGFPERLALEVIHILLAHHGQLEYGSPKAPATAEALVIHFADDLDAKLDMIKEAGSEIGTEEAFVRGLRRSFLYRNEQGESSFAEATEDRGRRQEGEGGKQGEEQGKEQGEGRREERIKPIPQGNKGKQEKLF